MKNILIQNQRMLQPKIYQLLQEEKGASWKERQARKLHQR